jgi:erythritol transport system ATP-binding protein
MCMETDNEICLKARSVTKVYPGTVALDNVDFNIYKGKVNVLIGENGAGKSTLMKIIAGIEVMTSGSLILDGKEIKIGSIQEAEEHGIGIIHQELNLFSNLNIYQNIFMNREFTKHKFFLDNQKHKSKTNAILEKLEHHIDLNMTVGNLKVGQKQIIEIAKAVIKRNLKILIMDEPTSSLSTAEVEVLFKIIRELTASGISIVYISHRMGEILQIGDYVTVLRDGRNVKEEVVKNIDISWMVSNMLGHEQNIDEKRQRSFGDEELLCVRNVTLYNEYGGKTLNNISFSVKKGEILGIYGLLGAGRTELMEVLMGMHPEASGEFYFENSAFMPKSISGQIKKGFSLIPEDRQKEGLIQTMNIEKNITISSLKKYKKGLLLSPGVIDEKADKMIRELKIRVANKKLPILSLSGGNQQKVVISKYLLTGPKIILLDEPSRGIDIGAKEEVFNIIRNLADQGIAIVVIASELKEILSISDRILVMANGKITAEFTGQVEEWRLAAMATEN